MRHYAWIYNNDAGEVIGVEGAKFNDAQTVIRDWRLVAQTEDMRLFTKWTKTKSNSDLEKS